VLANTGVVAKGKHTESIVVSFNGLREQSAELLNRGGLADEIGLRIHKLVKVDVDVAKDGINKRWSVLEAVQAELLQASLEGKVIAASKTRLAAGGGSLSSSGCGHVRSSSSSSGLGSDGVSVVEFVSWELSSKLLDAVLEGVKELLCVDGGLRGLSESRKTLDERSKDVLQINTRNKL